MESKNPFYEKLKEYIGKEVKVKLKSGESFEGKLSVINFATMNFILEGKDTDYIIRDDMSYIEVLE